MLPFTACPKLFSEFAEGTVLMDLDDFISRYAGIAMQFDLGRRAVKGLGSDTAFERYAGEQLDHARELLKGREIPEGHWTRTEEGQRQYTESLRASMPKRLGEVLNRMRQNEVILLVTLMEATLKDIQRAILQQNLSLLRADRQIPLGRLIAGSRESMIAEEIEREVQILDRKAVKERAEYFDERLNLSWFDGTAVPLVEHVVTLRNRILHEDPNIVVGEMDMKLARAMTIAVPWMCIAQGAILYPKIFNARSNLDDLRHILEKQGRLPPTGPPAAA